MSEPLRINDDLGILRAEDHLKLLRSVAAPFAPKGIPVDDTEEFADGVMGLLKAVEGFDPTKHLQFSTYATACIHRAIVQGWRARNRKKRTGVMCSLEDHDVIQPEPQIEETKISDAIKLFFDPHPDDSETDIRNKKVLFEHHILQKTFAEIGDELGITRQRANQLGDAAIKLLKERFNLGDQTLDEFLA